MIDYIFIRLQIAASCYVTASQTKFTGSFKNIPAKVALIPTYPILTLQVLHSSHKLIITFGEFWHNRSEKKKTNICGTEKAQKQKRTKNKKQKQNPNPKKQI